MYLSSSCRHVAALVVEELLAEGHAGAAEALLRESGLASADASGRDVEACRARLSLREAIMARRCDRALELACRVDPHLRERDPRVHFRLCQQIVLDALSLGRMSEALTAAATYLTSNPSDQPRWPQDVELDRELGRTMALFVFAGDNRTPASADDHDDQAIEHSAPPALARMLTDEWRMETAQLVNRALLAAQGVNAHARLSNMLAQALKKE